MEKEKSYDDLSSKEKALKRIENTQKEFNESFDFLKEKVNQNLGLANDNEDKIINVTSKFTNNNRNLFGRITSEMQNNPSKSHKLPEIADNIKGASMYNNDIESNAKLTLENKNRRNDLKFVLKKMEEGVLDNADPNYDTVNKIIKKLKSSIENGDEIEANNLIAELKEKPFKLVKDTQLIAKSTINKNEKPREVWNENYKRLAYKMTQAESLANVAKRDLPNNANVLRIIENMNQELRRINPDQPLYEARFYDIKTNQYFDKLEELLSETIISLDHSVKIAFKSEQ